MRNAFIYVIIAVLALFSCVPQPSDIRMPEIARVEAVPANNGCTLVVTFEELFSREYEI